MEHYYLKLTSGERVALVGWAERQRKSEERLAAKLRANPSKGKLERAERVDESANAFRKIERMTMELDTLDLGSRLIRAWYYDEVRDYAVDALRNILDGTISDREGLDDWLHEAVDGSQIVIYTYKASVALLASNNDGACEEQMGEGTYTTEQRAYFALIMDVQEEMDSIVAYPPEDLKLPEDFDLDDETTWTVENEEGVAL